MLWYKIWELVGHRTDVKAVEVWEVGMVEVVDYSKQDDRCQNQK